jgi:transposase
VDAHTFTKQAEKVVCQKVDGNCFLGQESSADGGIHATRDHNNVRSVLRSTKKLRRAIQNKSRGMQTSGVVLLHDNARPHARTAARTRALLEHFNWELFVHPPHSPDFSPSDYRLLIYLKNWLRSQRFNNNEEFIEGVKTWLRLQTSLTQAYKSLFPGNIRASIPAVTTLRSRLIMYVFFVYNNIFSLLVLLTAHRRLRSEQSSH